MTDEEERNDEGSTQPVGEMRTIRVEHVFKKVGKDGTPQDFEPPHVVSGEGEKTVEERLQEKEAQLAALALKEFEDDKEAVLSQIPEDKREKAEEFIGDDPTKLEFLKYQLDLDKGEDGTEAVPPKGKVKKQGVKSATQTDSERKYADPAINMISELFGILKDPEKTEKEKAVANSKIDELYLQVAQGRKQNPNFKTIRGSITTCPSCGHVLENVDIDEGGTCPYCGWKRDGAKTRKIHHDHTFNPK